jgi:peptidoglycan hydrolase-like protein with peptidoglycan-binding domain
VAAPSRKAQTDPASRQPEAELADLQQLLSQLGFYKGTVDGKAGPKTAAAIEDYKISAGLNGIELDTAQLVRSARNNLMVTAAIPAKRPPVTDDGETPRNRTVETVVYERPDKPATDAESGNPPTSFATYDDPEIVSKVQTGLRKFAGDHIVVDGLYGSQTKEAISEFQSVFRMQVTGEIDGDLLEKMDAVGLINK